jgi:hypothetical protein
MRKFLRKFNWWYLFVMRTAKLVLAVPLAVAGVLGILFLFNPHDWRFWLLATLVPLYVAAEFLLTLDDLISYSRQKSGRGHQ